MTGARIRHAESGDLDALTRIYNHYVCETPVTFDLEPFAPEERAQWLAGVAPGSRHQLLVAADESGPLGYACSHAFRAKAAYDRTVETTIYLAPEAVGRGLGSRLYEALFVALPECDVHLAVAGITLPNPASLALHRRFGFEPVGTFCEVGHKFGRTWDVAWWQRRLGGAAGAVSSPRR